MVHACSAFISRHALPIVCSEEVIFLDSVLETAIQTVVPAEVIHARFRHLLLILPPLAFIPFDTGEFEGIVIISRFFGSFRED